MSGFQERLKETQLELEKRKYPPDPKVDELLSNVGFVISGDRWGTAAWIQVGLKAFGVGQAFPCDAHKGDDIGRQRHDMDGYMQAPWRFELPCQIQPYELKDGVVWDRNSGQPPQYDTLKTNILAKTHHFDELMGAITFCLGF